MFRRLLAAVAVSLLLLGLASCRSDPTVAAYVGDYQITVDDVDDYYAKAAADPLSAQAVSQYSGQIKPMLVSMLIYLSLLREATDQQGVSVSAGRIAQAREAVEPQRSSLTDARVLLPVEQLGELQAYRERLTAWASANNADNAAVEKKYNDALREVQKDNPVTVNPRFGKFDLKNVPAMLSSDAAVTPVPSASTQQP